MLDRSISRLCVSIYIVLCVVDGRIVVSLRLYSNSAGYRKLQSMRLARSSSNDL